MRYGRLMLAVVLVVSLLAGPARATDYNDDGGGDGYWKTPDTWDLNSGYPDDTPTQADKAIIDSHTVMMDVGFDPSSDLEIQMAGGTLKLYTKSNPCVISATINVTAASNLDSNQTQDTGAGIHKLDGVIKGSGKLSLTRTSGLLNVICSDGSNFSGGWDIGAARPNFYNNTSLGTGPVDINGGRINLQFTSTSASPIANTFNIGASGGTISQSSIGYKAGYYTGAINLSGDLKIYVNTHPSPYTTFAGPIDQAGNGHKLTLEPKYNRTRLSNANNNYGDLDIYKGQFSGYVEMTDPGSLGTGKITTWTGARLYLNTTDTPDWTLTNDLAGCGKIYVEGGAAELIAQGSSIGPGHSVGTLTIDGDLAFAQDQGRNASLDIEILGTWESEVLTGVTADLLAVTGDVTGMDNADLNVTVDPLLTLADLVSFGGGDDGNEYTILTCDNDLTEAPQFDPGTWTGEPGSPEYRGGSGSVVIVFGSAAPIAEPAGLGLLGLALLGLKKRRG